MKLRLTIVCASFALLFAAPLLAQHTEFRLDRYMYRWDRPGQYTFCEYSVSESGTEKMIGYWDYSTSPGKAAGWHFSAFKTSEAEAAEHMALPVSQEFMRISRPFAKAELKLNDRDRFALVVPIPADFTARISNELLAPALD